MKRLGLIWTLILIGSTIFFSCEKGTTDLEDSTLGIDVNKDKESLIRIFQMKAHFYEKDFPKPSKQLDDLPKLAFQLDTMEFEDGQVTIPFNVSKFASFICGVNLTVLDATGYWQIPKGEITGGSNGFLNIHYFLPLFVKSGSYSLVMNATFCSGDTSYTTNNDTLHINVSPPMPCGDSLTARLGIDYLRLTHRKFTLTDKKGKVRIRCSTGNVGNRVDVKYGGKYVMSTGTLLKPDQYPGGNSDGFIATSVNSGTQAGYKDFFFEHNPATAKFLELFVVGNAGNPIDSWTVTVFCPE